MKSKTTAGNRHSIISKAPAPLVALCFLTLIGVLVFNSAPAPAADAVINCDAHQGACSQSSGDLTVSLEITPRPVKAMQDLVFSVSIAGASPDQPPHIDLGMPAMKMGPNQVALKPTGPDTYAGSGVIVRCPSGKRTWFANVVVPGSGEVKFIFDVIY